MPTFTPPTIEQSVSGDPLFSRYSIPVGISVTRRGGNYGSGAYGSGIYGGGGAFTRTPCPALREIAGLVEGVDWFQGGRTYVIDDDTAAALTADGFTVTADAGYGVAPYGSQGYGY